MTQFSDLFGADRDVIQETGATAGQKLRVNTLGTDLEAFDLAVETSTVTGTVQSGTGVTAAVGNITGSQSVIDAWLALTTETGAVLRTGQDEGGGSSSTSIQFSGGTYDSVNNRINFTNHNRWNNAETPVSASFINFDDSNLAWELTGNFAQQGPTTVTGDLTVTGLSAGSVVSDADGNLSIGSGGGVSGTAYRVPVFNSTGDGLEDSAVVTFSNLADVNTTSIRLNNANTGETYNFFASTSNGNSGISVMFPIQTTGGADTVGEVFLQFGGLGNTTIFGPFDIAVFKSAANDPDGSDEGPFKGDETFFLTNGLDFTGDFARAAIPFNHADHSTISSLLTTGADTSTLSLGGEGNINLGFQNSKIVDVDTHNTYDVRAPLNVSGNVTTPGFFIGDGSQLTNLPIIENNTSSNTIPVWDGDSLENSPLTVAAGTAGSSTDDYVFTYNMSEAKWQLSNELVAAITTTALDAQIADGSSDFGLYLPSPDTVTPPSIYFNVQSAGDVPDPLATFFSFNGKDYDYTTGSGFGLSQSAGNYFISLFDNDLGSFIAGNDNDTLTMPVAQYPTAGASTPNVTTVTGNLTVTGETTLAIPTTASSVTSNANYKFRVTDDSADVGLPGHITFIHE